MKPNCVHECNGAAGSRYADAEGYCMPYAYTGVGCTATPPTNTKVC